MIEKLHWILGIGGGISLILAVIFKIVNVYVLTATPRTFFRFTVVCCLASIALSLIDLSSSLKKSSAPNAD